MIYIKKYDSTNGKSLLGIVKEDAFYTHNQTTPAAVWSVEHNLGKYPMVSVVDSTKAVVYGDITYIDENNLTITFAGAFAGKAYIN